MKTSYYQNPRLIAAQKAGAVAYALASGASAGSCILLCG